MYQQHDPKSNKIYIIMCWFLILCSSERPKSKFCRYQNLPTFRFPEIATNTETEMHTIRIPKPIPIPKPKDQNFEHNLTQF
jgi:hypothetical protein